VDVALIVADNVVLIVAGQAELAERMRTSRAQVDRILKAKGNVTIKSLQRAAVLVSRELRLELV
jgi:antitoxin HicB